MPQRTPFHLVAAAITTAGLLATTPTARAQALAPPLALPDATTATESTEDPILTTCKACSTTQAQALARTECTGEVAGRPVWVIDAGAYTVHAFACMAGQGGMDAAATPLPKDAVEGMASLRALEADLRAALAAGGLDPEAAVPNPLDATP